MELNFTCRLFAISIGYSQQYDESGIRLYGPIRKYRTHDGRTRWQCHMTLCWYDFAGNRIWRSYRQLPGGSLAPVGRIRVRA